MLPFFSFFFLNLKHVVAKIYFQTSRGMNESDVFLETLRHGSHNFTEVLVLNRHVHCTAPRVSLHQGTLHTSHSRLREEPAL